MAQGVAAFCIRSQYHEMSVSPLRRVNACGLFAPNALATLAVDHQLYGSRPIEQGIGSDFAAQAVLGPLAQAVPDYQVRADIALHGQFRGDDWTASSGHILGRFMAPLFGIAPTARVIWLRFGCFQRWTGDHVTETILILDLPSLMMQAGVWPLATAMGPNLMAPPPVSSDGLWPAGDGAESLAIVERMIGGLMKFDGSLKTMNMRDFFARNFWWFGPGPIGSFRGFPDYERGHATPFLTAFPDRVGGNHRARFGNGDYVASTGWPSITATHKGSGWLGTKATGRAITMRVMDFWHARFDDEGHGLLDENWVMIDIPDVLHQIGIDVFAASTKES
jgi:hypothetical protein